MKIKLKVLSAILLVLTVLITPFALKPIRIEAGASKANVASIASVVDGRINTGDFMVSGGVSAKGTAIVFNEDCSSSSKIIGKTKIVNLKKNYSNFLGFKIKVRKKSKNARYTPCATSIPAFLAEDSPPFPL